MPNYDETFLKDDFAYIMMSWNALQTRLVFNMLSNIVSELYIL